MNEKINYKKSYNKALNWIKKYTIGENGIAVTSKNKIIYPEVSGYFIPSLIKINKQQLAISYADYLVSIQNSNGSWCDPSGKVDYTFDTGMILKGLWALIESNLDCNGKYRESFSKGADYIVSKQTKQGSITTDDYSQWNLPYCKRVPEAIHLYCLEPILKAGDVWGIDSYKSCVTKALDYYLKSESLTDFNTLSHFNAYIIEGLIDVYEVKRAKRAMDLISLHQREDGAVSAYSNQNFVCSTGLFQYAICWYKLGEVDKANKAFEFAIKLQNDSGGWYGSYGKRANYFPQEEISWAVKYFLDAFYFSNLGE